MHSKILYKLNSTENEDATQVDASVSTQTTQSQIIVAAPVIRRYLSDIVDYSAIKKATLPFPVNIPLDGHGEKPYYLNYYSIDGTKLAKTIRDLVERNKTIPVEEKDVWLDEIRLNTRTGTTRVATPFKKKKSGKARVRGIIDTINLPALKAESDRTTSTMSDEDFCELFFIKLKGIDEVGDDTVSDFIIHLMTNHLLDYTKKISLYLTEPSAFLESIGTIDYNGWHLLLIPQDDADKKMILRLPKNTPIEVIMEAQKNRNKLKAILYSSPGTFRTERGAYSSMASIRRVIQMLKTQGKTAAEIKKSIRSFNPKTNRAKIITLINFDNYVDLVINS